MLYFSIRKIYYESLLYIFQLILNRRQLIWDIIFLTSVSSHYRLVINCLSKTIIYLRLKL